MRRVALQLTLLLIATSGCLNQQRLAAPDTEGGHSQDHGTNDGGNSSLLASGSPTVFLPDGSAASSATPRVVASHSSARLVSEASPFASGQVTGADGTNWTWIPQENESFELLVPFLEPEREYTAKIRLASSTGQEQAPQSIRFATGPSPSSYAKADTALVYPGAAIHIGGTCTLGFLARDATNETLYGFTVAHCFDGKNDKSVVMVDGPNGEVPIGTLAGYQRDGSVDWAAIQLLPNVRTLVNPAVEHWTGPTGLAGADAASRDDPICHVGHGGIFDLHNAERRPRCGDFIGYHSTPLADGRRAIMFEFESLAYVGDSGGPIIHHDTGLAMGMLVGTIGPTGGPVLATPLCTALEAAYEQGLDLQVLPAAYAPPEATSIPAWFPGAETSFNSCILPGP